MLFKGRTQTRPQRGSTTRNREGRSTKYLIHSMHHFPGLRFPTPDVQRRLFFVARFPLAGFCMHSPLCIRSGLVFHHGCDTHESRVCPAVVLAASSTSSPHKFSLSHIRSAVRPHLTPGPLWKTARLCGGPPSPLPPRASALR